ncbi:MAG: hypothetical protein AAFY02_13270 [Pseudomonadota bacterium]
MRQILFGLGLAGLLALGLPTSGQAASFNCAEAKAADEIAVCDSRALSEADVKMATLYDVLTNLVGMGQRGEIHDKQVAWLKRRADCGRHVSCLRRAYNARIAVLQADLQKIYENGPY